MNENQFTPETGSQQNQPLQDNLTDNQIPSGSYQQEESENTDRNTQREFPERTQQHDYKNPSANQMENTEDDEVDTDGEIFEEDDETNTDPVDEQTDVSNLGLV